MKMYNGFVLKTLQKVHNVKFNVKLKIIEVQEVHVQDKRIK